MLSRADNELITRTGPGTGMGELFRRFWVPALLSSELPEPDCTPVAFGLLGEELIGFRTTSGKAAILEARCPHRHASLFWGRNEEEGIRCAYHGWKFGADGACLEQPAEPADSHYKEAVRALAYEVHEAGGIVWVYMGPRDKVPAFPAFEWTLLDEDHYLVTKRRQLCNYLQNLEGELDTAHVNFLHREKRRVSFLDRESRAPDEPMLPPSDLARKQFFLSETNFGLVAMARSERPDDEYYWRMTPFILPTFTIIPSPMGAANTMTAVVPIDDENAWGFTVTWHPARPLDEEEIETVTGGAGVHVHVDPETFIPLANKTNKYLIDRELQRTQSFTGIFGVRNQDLAVQENQDGTICKREEEHLGVTDRGIVGMRRLLLTLAKDLQKGIEPRHLQHPEAFRARSLAVDAPRDVDPVELFAAAQPETVDAASLGSAY
jgi:phenylpropionate dioxygenase-like ring-hydroxylating dioxygenase large terminal subunit